MEKNKLKFSDIDSKSDLEKQIEGEVTEEDINKSADLYYKTLYVAVPRSHDQSLGVFPEDQQLANSYVLLWDSVKGIPTSLLDNADYKVLKVTVNDDAIKSYLRPMGSGVYALKHIPNTLPIEEVDNISYRSE